MIYNVSMESTFEAEKNKKAFAYTAAICGVLLLLAYFISWHILPIAPPVAQDLLEINLGNNQEGFGELQPLIKGQRAPAQQQTETARQRAAAAKVEASRDIQPDENAEENAAPVTKPDKPIPKATNIAKEPVTQPVKTNNTAPVEAPAPKPQKPKITYDGPGNGSGNGATEDNGYKSQGNKQGGKGDAGDPSGKPDSYGYGNSPGGRVGGLRVSKGDRTIVNNYIFMAELPKATINAIIRVSPEGKGTFVSMDKGSTSSDSRYVSKIRSYLPNIQFSKSDHESLVTVPFNFKVQ